MFHQSPVFCQNAMLCVIKPAYRTRKYYEITKSLIQFIPRSSHIFIITFHILQISVRTLKIL